MGLTNLVQVKAGENPAVAAYNPSPTSRYTGITPETEVGFAILGYLVSNPNLMLFQVSDAGFTDSSLSINTTAQSNTLNVSDTGGQNSSQQISFYTVDFGVDTSSNSWSLTFNLTLKNGSTGSWIFTKGKTDDDSIPKY